MRLKLVGLMVGALFVLGAVLALRGEVAAGVVACALALTGGLVLLAVLTSDDGLTERLEQAERRCRSCVSDIERLESSLYTAGVFQKAADDRLIKLETEVKEALLSRSFGR